MENQNAPIFISPSPKKETIVIDIDGNILSSKDPKEAVIIQRKEEDK